jgi:hypothetical protein
MEVSPRMLHTPVCDVAFKECCIGKHATLDFKNHP